MSKCDNILNESYKEIKKLSKVDESLPIGMLPLTNFKINCKKINDPNLSDKFPFLDFYEFEDNQTIIVSDNGFVVAFYKKDDRLADQLQEIEGGLLSDPEGRIPNTPEGDKLYQELADKYNL